MPKELPASLKIEYEKIATFPTVSSYKCLLKYEKRQYTMVLNLPKNGVPTRLDILQDIQFVFGTLRKYGTFVEFAVGKNITDIRKARKKYEEFVGRAKRYQRLFGQILGTII